MCKNSIFRFFENSKSLRIITCLIICLNPLIEAQNPHFLPVKKERLNNQIVKSVACPDQFAGTISFSNFVGQSNDIDLDTIYFCFNDQIDVLGNGDADLSGDPNPQTVPGITYAFYECLPTVQGSDLTTILTDECIFDDPIPANGIFVTQGGTPNGNLTLLNDGIIQFFFNAGSPVLTWYAPITIDDFLDVQWENDGSGTPDGPCVHAHVEEAFAIVYLNEITVSNIDNNTGMDGCQGSFKIEGGLPEFDDTKYQIVIQNINNPNILGTIDNQNEVTHGETVIFHVPEGGSYTVFVEDDKSCGTEFSITMDECLMSPSCFNEPDSIFCINTLRDIVETMPCNSYLPDSSQLIDSHLGEVMIDNIAHAFLTRTFVDVDGVEMDSFLFSDCTGMIVESCVGAFDTLICQMGILNENSFSNLIFNDAWNCTIPLPDCLFSAVFEQKKPIPLSIFPNPTSDFFSFKTHQDMDFSTIRCTDIFGKQVELVIQNNDDIVEIRLKYQHSGLYFISIEGSERIFNGRILMII